MSGPGLFLDASTAILLAKLDLLREVAGRGRVLMTNTAASESCVKDSDDARMIAQLIKEKKIEKVTPEAGTEPLVRDFGLDPGEAETVATARFHGGICGTDDGPAIKCCRALGVPFTSAVGLLAVLAEDGTLKSDLALALLAKLERYGRYGAQIVEDVARRIRAAKPEKEGGSK